MKEQTEHEEESPQIAFGGSLDDEAARKYLRALDRLGIKTESLDARVGAEITGGQSIEV